MARISGCVGHNVVGDKVKRYREEYNMSQKELAEKLEMEAVYICRGSISRIERHERTVTDYELEAMARVLKVKIDDLYEER